MHVKSIMISPALVLLVALCVTRIYGQAFEYPVCAPPHTTMVAPGVSFAPPPLPVLPDSFQVKVEANIIDRKFTNIAEEYYDGLNNRAAVRMFRNDTIDYMILDYANNQILYDVNNNCYATDMKYDENNLLFGMKTPNRISHVYTTNGALHFAKANGLTYMGKSTVRGVPADHWQSCMYWQKLQSNFTLDYYFSVYNWTEGDLSHQVPLRAEIKGLQTSIGTSSNNYQFHHLYEYFDFRNKIWSDDTVFQTPRMTVCTGRKQTRAVPVLSDQYSFREEIISTGNQVVSQSDIWYDYTNKRVRFDYRPSVLAFPYYATNPVKEVHDYSTGIAYAMDKAQGNCTIMPIEKTTFDAKRTVSKTPSGQQIYIQMMSPSQMFFLDNTSYTYEGKRTVRGILCDAFIFKRTDFSLPGYDTFNSTFELCFLDQSGEEFNNDGVNSAQSSGIPIQMVFSTPDLIGFHATYNIYNWDAEEPAASNFDITSCYSSDNKKSIIIEFPGHYDVPTLIPYKSALLTSTISTLSRLTHMSHIRIQNAQFNIAPDNIYFVATLLDLPPPTAFFENQFGMYNPGGNGHVISTRGIDVTTCATFCNNQTTTCNSFDFYISSGVCTLYSSRSDKLASSSTCNHYSRSVASLPFEMPLKSSLTQLKNEIIAGNFKISVQMNGIIQSYHAAKVDIGVVHNAGGNLQTHSTASLPSEMSLETSRTPVKHELTTDNVKTSIQMNVVTQSSHAPKVITSVVHNANRNLQNQSLMDQFTVQNNTVLKDGYGDHLATGISVDDCAKQCISKNKWVCNSFYYCFNTGYCVESKLYPDSKPSAVINMELCDLYSRKPFAGGTPCINNPEKYYHTKTSHSGYSGGVMAGLAFAMLIVGAILGLAGYFVYKRIRGVSNDNMAVSFVKLEGK